MYDYEELIWYAEQLYDMKVKVSYSADKSIMFIKTPFDYFKIFLKDYSRFGYYTISHQNKKENKAWWHRQATARTLRFAVFICLVHGFNKIYNIWYTQEDFERFTYDARRALNYVERTN